MGVDRILDEIYEEEERLKEDREKLKQYQEKFQTDIQNIMIKALHSCYDDGITDEESIILRTFIGKVNTYAGKLHN